MLAKMLVIFTVVPLLELFVLIKLGTQIGLWPTILIVALTGVVGVLLARTQGFAILFRIREDLENGRLPAEELLNGLCVLVGGAMLLTPGLITDTLGFSLIIPFTRTYIKMYIKKVIKNMLRRGEIKFYKKTP